MINNLAINQNTGDLDESANQINQVTELDAVAQNLYSTLKLFLGEYWLNKSLGVAYYEVIFQKNVDLSIKKTLIKNEILKKEYVIEITKFEAAFDSPDRKLGIVFSAITTSGIITDLEVEI